jgi:hypothetical protein
VSSGSGYRKAPSSDAPPQKKGFLDAVFGYRPPGDAEMPKIRTALTRGAVAVGSTPWLLALSFGTVLVVWLAVVAGGFPGPFGAFSGTLAVPPVSTTLDVTLPLLLLPTKLALFGSLLSVLPRGIFLALATGMIVDALDGKPISAASLRHGMRALPTAIGLCILSVGFWIFEGLSSQLLGPGIGTLIQVGIPALGIYLFGFAVTIAVSERRSMADSLSKSVRAARLPGSSNLTFAIIYAFGAIVLQLVFVATYRKLDVNPAATAWAWILVVNLLHMCVYAALAFRYLYIADSVPDAPPRRVRATEAGASKGPARPGRPVGGSKQPSKRPTAKKSKNRRR